MRMPRWRGRRGIDRRPSGALVRLVITDQQVRVDDVGRRALDRPVDAPLRPYIVALVRNVHVGQGVVDHDRGARARTVTQGEPGGTLRADLESPLDGDPLV